MAEQSLGPCQSDVDDLFARAFKDYEMDLETTPVKDAIARLKSRPEAYVREVVGSLDHWLIFRHNFPTDRPSDGRKETTAPRTAEIP